MPDYRRFYQNGGTYFFTVVTDHRRPIFCEDAAVSLLHKCLTDVNRSHPFVTEAIVLMPDHLHTIWTLPDGDSDFSTRWSLVKGSFSRQSSLPSSEYLSQTRLRKRERGVWQRRFWEHLVRDQKEFNRLCDYIHYNPVKHGLVGSPEEWKHSTYNQFVQRGMYTKNQTLSDARPLSVMDLE